MAQGSTERLVVCGEGGPLEGRRTTLLTVSLSQEKAERRSLVPVVLSDQIELSHSYQSVRHLSVSFSKCQPAAIFNKLCLSSCQRCENTSYVRNGQRRTIKKNCSICSDPPGLWKPNKRSSLYYWTCKNVLFQLLWFVRYRLESSLNISAVFILHMVQEHKCTCP